LILIILENNEPSDNVKTIDFLTYEHKTALIERNTLKNWSIYNIKICISENKNNI